MGSHPKGGTYYNIAFGVVGVAHLAPMGSHPLEMRDTTRYEISHDEVRDEIEEDTRKCEIPQRDTASDEIPRRK